MHSEDSIQRAIQYMENRLAYKMTLEEIAAHVGFSPFHFHRLFRSRVGMNIADYLRSRRLCQASRMLLHTEESILHISLDCHFESQEAFTRAFKKMYGMPPGRYRNVFRLHNDIIKGEKVMNTGSPIKDWFLSGSHPHEYEIGIDRDNVHLGNASGFLRAICPQDVDSFATLMQQFNAEKFRGRRMKFSGFVRTSDVTEFCGLWMRVDNNHSDVLQFDNMNNRKIIGDTNWNHYAIVLDIPEQSATISIGVLLMGFGKVWVDSLQFEEVDESVPTTNLEFDYKILDEPSNLSFEE
ncbi:helix-turn-helix domain-containing protein [Paenibacillus yanchengensis]|uniref:Helix-turn-helix domain-containing protein n=1 Tax=Paenibacillus yanchengensis TaxID=2035833 RepID=A0ABW4YHV9_9BACL